jgi:hypothetical protein
MTDTSQPLPPPGDRFTPYPKTPRLNREVIVTEKVDGSNGQVYITDDPIRGLAPVAQIAQDGQLPALVYAGSRNRWVHPGDDNFGFAAWVASTAGTLVDDLGHGRHYGEWYGKGINRNPYEIQHKAFALFNPFTDLGSPATPHLGVVPLLAVCDFQDLQPMLKNLLAELRAYGTCLPNILCDYAEGVVVYHTAGRQTFKVTLVGDETPKRQQHEKASITA